MIPDCFQPTVASGNVVLNTTCCVSVCHDLRALVSANAIYQRVCTNLCPSIGTPQALLAKAEARLAGVSTRPGWVARLVSGLAGSFVGRIIRDLSVTVRSFHSPPPPLSFFLRTGKRTTFSSVIFRFFHRDTLVIIRLW